MLNNLQDNETETRKNETKTAARDTLKALEKLVLGSDESQSVSSRKKPAPVVRLTESERVRIQDARLSGENIFEICVFLEATVHNGRSSGISDLQ